MHIAKRTERLKVFGRRTGVSHLHYETQKKKIKLNRSLQGHHDKAYCTERNESGA